MNREIAEVMWNARRQTDTHVGLWEDAHHDIRQVFLLMADAVLQHLASQRQEQGMSEYDDDQIRALSAGTVRDLLDERDALRAQAAAQGDTLRRLVGHRESLGNAVARLTEERNTAQTLVARLGEALKWDHNTQGPNHVRSSCDVCALLAELAPTTPTP